MSPKTGRDVVHARCGHRGPRWGCQGHAHTSGQRRSPRARAGRWSAPATVSGCTTCSPRSSLPPTAPALRRPGPPRWNAASRGWTPRRCRPAGAPPAAATRRCAPAPAGSERLRPGRRAGGRASRPSSSRTHQGLSARAAPARPLAGAARLRGWPGPPRAHAARGCWASPARVGAARSRCQPRRGTMVGQPCRRAGGRVPVLVHRTAEGVAGPRRASGTPSRGCLPTLPRGLTPGPPRRRPGLLGPRPRAVGAGRRQEEREMVRVQTLTACSYGLS
jgi:hypothetical protein